MEVLFMWFMVLFRRMVFSVRCVDFSFCIWFVLKGGIFKVWLGVLISVFLVMRWWMVLCIGVMEVFS